MPLGPVGKISVGWGIISLTGAATFYVLQKRVEEKRKNRMRERKVKRREKERKRREQEEQQITTQEQANS